MGKISPVNQVVGTVLGAIAGNVIKPSVPVIPPVTVAPPLPVMPDKVEDTTAAQKSAHRDLGVGSTVLTSLRGLLDLNKFAPPRKSLLGE